MNVEKKKGQSGLYVAYIKYLVRFNTRNFAKKLKCSTKLTSFCKLYYGRISLCRQISEIIEFE